MRDFRKELEEREREKEKEKDKTRRPAIEHRDPALVKLLTFLNDFFQGSVFSDVFSGVTF